MMIFSTMTGLEEPFEAIHPNRVNIFVCGPTVYDDAHIGHARTYIAFDVIARYLTYRGYSVFYIQNITDVDDKIIQRASDLGEEPLCLARKFEKRYLEDMRRLGVNAVNLYARATEHIPEILIQIETLIQKGFAYETETGVYFDESKFPDFGKLSHQNAEELKEHRIEPDPTKRNSGDFALWKKRDEGPTWDSPWGRGRPGWHIEDTAITETYFGPQYDIHGGARDLIFPHHEAEIAQMEASSGKKPMVRYWMHTGFLNVTGEKMSKSLGNFITIREILEKYDPETFRFYIASTHYRSPIDFSGEALDQSKRSLERIRNLVWAIDGKLALAPKSAESDGDIAELVASSMKEFLKAMDDDFNTPDALSVIFELVRQANRTMMEAPVSSKALAEIRGLLLEFGTVFGLSLLKPCSGGEEDIAGKLVEVISDVRQKLRERKDWALSDEIRNRLRDLNITLEDRKTTLEDKKSPEGSRGNSQAV